MNFRNAKIYQYTGDTLDVAHLADVLSQHPVTELTEQQPFSFGWMPPLKQDGAPAALEVCFNDNRAIVLLCRESYRSLPAAVINEEVAKRAAIVEKNENRHIGRRERAEIREAVYFELLPKAFIKHRDTAVMLFDDWVVVDACSAARAEEVLEQLRSALGSLPIVPVVANAPMGAVFTPWLTQEVALPDWCRFGTDLHLEGREDDKVKFSGFDFDDIEQLEPHIGAGKTVCLIGLETAEAAFTIDDKMTLRKVRLSDVLLDAMEEIQGESEGAIIAVSYTIVASMLLATIARLDNLLQLKRG